MNTSLQKQMKVLSSHLEGALLRAERVRRQLQQLSAATLSVVTETDVLVKEVGSIKQLSGALERVSPKRPLGRKRKGANR